MVFDFLKEDNQLTIDGGAQVARQLLHHLWGQHCVWRSCCSLSLQQGSPFYMQLLIVTNLMQSVICNPDLEPLQVTHRAQVEIWRRLTQFLLSLRQQVGFEAP